MNLQLDNKVVVVTGGAKGIGGACTDRYVEEGARVAVVDVDDVAGTDRVADKKERAAFFKCDVSNSVNVSETFQKIVDLFGGIDILVNNAGIQRYSTVTETTDEEWDLVLGTNLNSAFYCARSAIPSMLKRGGGVVVNVSSVQAMLSQANVAPYTTSKTAMLGLTRSIAVDYAPTVRSVAICPGSVDTPLMMWAANQSPDPDDVFEEVNHMHLVGRMADPVEVADLILLVSSPKGGFFTGQPIRIDGGLGTTIPGSKR